MKKILILSFLFVLFLGIESVEATVLPSAQQLSITKVEAFKDRGQREKEKTGTGFFIDYRGCLLTTAHLVYEEGDSSALYGHFKVWVNSSIRKEPDQSYAASLIYADIKNDLAILCIDDTDGNFFYPFEFAQKNHYPQLNLEDTVTMGGFPLIGGKTVMFTNGLISGFWSQPDLVNYLRNNVFEGATVDLIKTDMPTGPGGSGSPVWNEWGEVIGILFASSLSPGGINFIISSDSIHQFLEDKVESERAGDCLWKEEEGLFHRQGLKFYDARCQSLQNLEIEKNVDFAWKNSCRGEVLFKNKYQVVDHITSGQSTLVNWEKYLEGICNTGKAVDNSVLNSTLSLGPGTFAYGKTRLSSFSAESDLAQKLSLVLREKFQGDIPISDMNWAKLVNAFIYGGYDVESIHKSILLGGMTVHPSIPFSQWKKSADYKAGMAK